MALAEKNRVMMKMIIFVIFMVNYVLLAERLPRPIEDEDHKLLMSYLQKEKFEMEHLYNKSVKRIYRLYHSKRYAVKKVTDPLMGKEQDRLVS